MSNNLDIAWAAGFFEGEGNVGCKCSNDPRYPSGSTNYLRIQVAQVHREPLDKLQRLFGGKVFGPYGPYTTQRKPYYTYIAHGRIAELAITQMLPYLYHKGDQAREALSKMEITHS